MPGEVQPGNSGTNMYYSYDIACVHFLAIDSESVFDVAGIQDEQLSFIEKDLQQYQMRKQQGMMTQNDNSTCTRDAPKWLVVYMHRVSQQQY